MTIYGLAGGAFEEFKKNDYKKWPDPFKNAPTEIRVLACQHTFQAKIKMYGLGFGAWAWSAFVPQPTEIVRKTLTGSYKCGFYFGLKFKSPLNFVIEESGVAAFAEMVRPVVTGLFYIWAADTLFSLLDQWQSMVYAMEMCDVIGGECLLAEGSGSLYFESGQGSPGFYDVLYDHPQHYSWPGGDVEWHEPKYVAADAMGHILAGSGIVHNIRVFFARGSIEPIPGSEIWESGPMNPGDVATFSISFGGLQNPGTLQIVVDYSQTHTGLQHSTILVQRWTTSFRDAPYFPCGNWKPSVLPVLG